MDKDTIIAYLKEHKKEFFINYGILFGSYARDEETINSDINLIIELENNTLDIYKKRYY